MRAELRRPVSGRRLTAAERRQQALAQVVERVLETLGADELLPVERRVLKAITEGAALGELKKARQLALETGLSLRELEKACDGLLDKGFIGPAPLRRRGKEH